MGVFSSQLRRTVQYILADSATLNPPNRKPFFAARLSRRAAEELEQALAAIAAESGRAWFTLTATYEQPCRLRLTQLVNTPKYESQAAPIYLRGDVFRVNGAEGSCNIEFSRTGADLLKDRLADAKGKMFEWLEIRVPSRARQIVEFAPDSQLMDEAVRMGLAGEFAASQAWEPEDFSDWQNPG